MAKTEIDLVEGMNEEFQKNACIDARIAEAVERQRARDKKVLIEALTRHKRDIDKACAEAQRTRVRTAVALAPASFVGACIALILSGSAWPEHIAMGVACGLMLFAGWTVGRCA